MSLRRPTSGCARAQPVVKFDCGVNNRPALSFFGHRGACHAACSSIPTSMPSVMQTPWLDANNLGVSMIHASSLSVPSHRVISSRPRRSPWAMVPLPCTAVPAPRSSYYYPICSSLRVWGVDGVRPVNRHVFAPEHPLPQASYLTVDVVDDDVGVPPGPNASTIARCVHEYCTVGNDQSRALATVIATLTADRAFSFR